MEEKLVTLAILTFTKAQILKNVLENEGIEAYIHNVNLIQPVISSGVRVRIKESDLPHAMQIIEDSSWLTENIDEEEAEPKENRRQPIVMVPVDFSDYSLRACKFAFSFANVIHAKVVLFHAYYYPVNIPLLPFAVDSYEDMAHYQEASVQDLLQNIQKEFDSLKDEIEKRIAAGELAKADYECVLRDGIPEEEILHYARFAKPQIIIMGTRGKNEKNIDLIGSVTAEVLERSKTFVYAIPKHTDLKTFEDIKRVAFLTNFEQRDLIAFNSLIMAFKSYQFKVYFIHLSDGKNAWDEVKLGGIREYFHHQYPNLDMQYKVIKQDEILNNLDEYIKAENIDVIGLPNYKRSFLARLFNPGLSRKMLFHSNTPILLIK